MIHFSFLTLWTKSRMNIYIVITETLINNNYPVQELWFSVHSTLNRKYNK